jgi:hypothetical protein
MSLLFSEMSPEKRSELLSIDRFNPYLIQHPISITSHSKKVLTVPSPETNNIEA